MIYLYIVSRVSLPVPSVDLSVRSFTLTTETLVADASTGFELTASVALTNGMTLPASRWPHFHYTLYVSKDVKLVTRDDYEIIYRFVSHNTNVMILKTYTEIMIIMFLYDIGGH